MATTARDLPAFMLWPIPVDVAPDAYQTPIMAWQGDRCAMCGRSDMRLIEDHCHDSGKVRGMLCVSCNLEEGKSSAPAWELWRAGMNPARIIGDDRTYISPRSGRPVIRQHVTDDMRAAAAGALGHIFSGSGP